MLKKVLEALNNIIVIDDDDDDNKLLDINLDN